DELLLKVRTVFQKVNKTNKF
ncbi:type II toxin-antitoxin system PemK/MazF family toxin, partial [Enterococcus faecalis]|nr:type II toxin-antitoxin system PemK/MazF family toxin [Enterococcus faecalis]